MGYKDLKSCVEDLEKMGELVRVKHKVDPNLEMAAIQRRVNNAQGPALLFENIKNTKFQALSNVYGTNKRVDYIFRKEIRNIQALAKLRNNFHLALKKPFKTLSCLPSALHSLPRKSKFKNEYWQRIPLNQLPKIKSWPHDGGSFITLPQVLSEDPEKKGLKHTNIGMYRIQLDGNEYLNQEAGLHYQIHRGIGVHHTKYKALGEKFKVSIHVGGPPAHTVAAILPLPESLSETMFSGLLNSKPYNYALYDGYYINTDADFCILGEVDPLKLKEEGPFGDHLGYYSLKHPFPFIEVKHVLHKPNAIWHFTVVGRPPAEDSGFGYLIHQLFGDTIMHEFPGIKALHAVDAAGVHPLLLAIGTERYMPFREQQPEEILIQANHILGKGQTSLAKYLFIIAPLNGEIIDLYDVKSYLEYCFERIDFRRDIHFQTKTTIDTLDYSGTGLNAGSKVIFSIHGEKKNKLISTLSSDFNLNSKFSDFTFFARGIVVLKAPKYISSEEGLADVESLRLQLKKQNIVGIALLVLCDDASFTALNVNNFAWVTFTRSNPASDLHGMNEQFEDKHWCIDAPLIIDARIKPHHAPELIEDQKIQEKVDSFFTQNGPLSKWG